MEGELEDGELIESDGENALVNKKNKSIEPLAVSSLWHGVPVSGCGSELGYMTTLNSKIMTSRRLPQGLPSSESEDDRSADDSDDEERPRKKPRTRIFGESGDDLKNVPSAGSSDNGMENQRPTKQKKRKYNIWGSILQDQMLSSGMSAGLGLDPNVESDRNVETYNYLRALDDVREPRVVGTQNRKPRENQEMATDDHIPDICDMETFGTAGTKPKSRPGSKLGERDDVGGDGERISLKRKHGGQFKCPVRSRLGSRGYDDKKDRSHIRVTFSDESSAVIDEIMRVLKEPPDTKDIFTRVVQAIGVEESLKLLYKTEDLEKAGGLMTMDGHRRRTAGGVYLYLVKVEVAKESLDFIFQNQREQAKRRQKSERNRKITERCRDMELALGISVPPDRCEPKVGCSGAIGDWPAGTESSDGGALKVRKESEKLDEEKMEDGNFEVEELDPTLNIELDFA